MTNKKSNEILQIYKSLKLNEEDIVNFNSALDDDHTYVETKKELDDLMKHQGIAKNIHDIYKNFENSEDKFVTSTLSHITKKSKSQRLTLKKLAIFSPVLAIAIFAIIAIPFGSPDPSQLKNNSTGTVSIEKTLHNSQKITHQLRTTDYSKNRVTRYMQAKPFGSI